MLIYMDDCLKHILSGDFFEFDRDLFEKIEMSLESAKEKCVLMDEESMKKKIGRNWKSFIRKSIFLIQFIQEKVNSKDYLFIPQTHPKLLKHYSQSAISEKIKILKKCDILHDLNIDYIIRRQAKYYYVCRENLNTYLKIYQGIAQSNSAIPSLAQPTSAAHLLPNPNDTPISSRVHIDAKLYLEDDIKRAVYSRYPVIPYYQKYVAELNKHIQFNEEKIRFEPTITIKKDVYKRIGFRATNQVCFLPSIQKNQKHRVVPQWREDYLYSRFGEWQEYDIKGSVPRISRAMHLLGGSMADLNEDIYKTIFEDFVDDYRMYFDSTVLEWDKRVRDFFKLMFMRLYFGGSPKEIRARILSYESNERNAHRILLTPFNDLKSQGVNLDKLF